MKYICVHFLKHRKSIVYIDSPMPLAEKNYFLINYIDF